MDQPDAHVSNKNWAILLLKERRRITGRQFSGSTMSGLAPSKLHAAGTCVKGPAVADRKHPMVGESQSTTKPRGQWRSTCRRKNIAAKEKFSRNLVSHFSLSMQTCYLCW